MYVGRGTDGRRRYLTRTIHGTKRFAEDMLPELLMEAGRGDHVVTDGTLADLVQKWRPIAELNLSPATLQEYERLLDKRILPRSARRRCGRSGPLTSTPSTPTSSGEAGPTVDNSVPRAFSMSTPCSVGS